MPPPLPASRPSFLPHLLALTVTGLLALLLARAIGFGSQLAPSRVPFAPVLVFAAISAVLELGLLTASRLGRWQERLGAVMFMAAAQGLSIFGVCSWLAAHADLLGWSFAVVLGLLFLLLLAAALLALLSWLRALCYWRLFSDPRASWLGPVVTLAPCLAAALGWRLLG